MPRGSAPGERRGGRKKGTPNRRTFVLKQAMGDHDVRRISAGLGDSVDFLRKLYQDESQPLMVRIECAKVVALFDRPRLTATTNRDGKDLPRNVLPSAEYRMWARQQIREAFGLPPLTIEHGDEGEDAS
jgi:hypothetical protein